MTIDWGGTHKPHRQTPSLETFPMWCQASPSGSRSDLLQKQIHISHDAMRTNAPYTSLPGQIVNPSDEQFRKWYMTQRSSGQFSILSKGGQSWVGQLWVVAVAVPEFFSAFRVDHRCSTSWRILKAGLTPVGSAPTQHKPPSWQVSRAGSPFPDLGRPLHASHRLENTSAVLWLISPKSQALGSVRCNH